MRNKISIIIKFVIATFAFVGVFVACFFAVRDGYSHWYKRLFYFTQQSNLWIAFTCLTLAIIDVVELNTGRRIKKSWLYIFKFIFTISITLTGLIFCCVLAPFAFEGYNTWSFSSITTHVIVPVLSIVDFVLDVNKINLKWWHCFLGLIPPLIYYIFALIMGSYNVDFGMGEPYPYLFLNYKTEAGWFGFVNGHPPMIGAFYWLIFLIGLILFFSFVYYFIRKRVEKHK